MIEYTAKISPALDAYQISDDGSRDTSDTPRCGAQSHGRASSGCREQLRRKRVNAGEATGNEQFTQEEEHGSISPGIYSKFHHSKSYAPYGT